MLLKTIYMILYPNAKINIGLNILSKREDNYHNISSIFYPIFDCYDILEIKRTNKFLFTSSGLKIPGKKNLCQIAYEAIKNKFDISPVHIHLHKLIPIGSGLGGGSSDASFVLKGLNQIFDLKLSNSDLEKISKDIGADCPFFIENKTKHVTGIGDKMKKINLDLSNYTIKLTHSNINISTANAFSKIKANEQNIVTENLSEQSIESWKNKVKNDFENNVFEIYPQLKIEKEKFYSEGAIYSSMTGTGSTIYGIFKK